MALIREDRYGLYVMSGGYIARPVETEDTRYVSIIANDSEYVPGDKVKAKHLRGSGMHEVGKELWSSHGCYVETDWDNDTTRTKNSEECWEPVQ